MAAKKSTAKDTASKASDTMREGAERLRDTGKTMAENSGVVGLKMIDQAEENTKSAFDAMRAAAQARDVSDVMKIQGDFMRDQGKRSMEQAREIGDLIAEFGRDAVSTMRGGK